MGDKFNKYAQGAKNFVAPKYDSDEDLSPEDQARIAAQERSSPSEADKLREQAWENAGPYPKLKRLVKDVWSGDKRKKQE